MKKTAIIVPVFNEENNINAFVDACSISLKNTSINYRICFIDDGSTDNTLLEIKNISSENKLVNYISFSRNFGHQNALKARLDQLNQQR